MRLRKRVSSNLVEVRYSDLEIRPTIQLFANELGGSEIFSEDAEGLNLAYYEFKDSEENAQEFKRRIKSNIKNVVLAKTCEGSINSSELQLFISIVESGDMTFSYLMSSAADELWEQALEDGQFEEDERRAWALDESRFFCDRGYPSFYFIDKWQQVPSNEWLIHFTDSDPEKILSEGFLGSSPEIAGLTKFNRDSGDLAFAYRVKNIKKFQKYGKNAILFKASQAIEVYHFTDEEDQVVFDTTSVTDVYGIEQQSEAFVLLAHSGQEIGVCDKVGFDCVQHFIDHIESKDFKVAASAKKYAHIDFIPPAGAAEEAAKALRWLKDADFGTPVGKARAVQLKNRSRLSPQTVRRMKAFFDRHSYNLDSESWKRHNPPEYIAPSRGAWALWGGDPGYAWAKKIIRQMEAADKKG